MILFSGSSHVQLARDIASLMKRELGKIRIGLFPDGEIDVEILEEVRGKNVYIIQSIAVSPNHFLMELLLIADALKRASAKSITAVVPYLGYSRQDRRNEKREPISARLVANMLETAGIGHLITLDLHTDQIEGFFDIPVDNLSSNELWVEEIKIKDLVVVSPDVGRSRFARILASHLKADIAIIDKKRISPNRVSVEALIGSVEGKNVLIVDDICSTGETLRTASGLCKEAGARGIFAAVTHGLFVRELENIEKMFVTDSVANRKFSNVQVVSCAPLFSEAISSQNSTLSQKK